MEITFHVTEQDYIDFNKYQLLHSAAGKKNLLIIRFLPLLFSVFLFLIMLMAGTGTGLLVTEAVVLGIISVLSFFFSERFVLKGMDKTIEKLKKDGKLPYSTDGRLIFTEEYIQEITAASETKVFYTSIEKVCVSEHIIYLFFSSAQAFLIPDSCFTGNGQKEQLLQFLQTKVNT